MRGRQEQKPRDQGLSGRERGAIEEFLAYIEERVRGSEPVCADLVRMARIALSGPEALDDLDRTLH